MLIRRADRCLRLLTALLLTLALLGSLIYRAWATGEGVPAESPASWDILGMATLALVAMVLWGAWISERKNHGTIPQAQLQPPLDALQQLENNYNSFRDNAPVGIFQSTPAGCFLYANTKMAKMLGYASPLELLHHVKDIGRDLYLEPAKRTELYSRLMLDGMAKNVELRFRKFDGEMAWISLSTRAIRKDAGVIDHVEGFAVDVTERKLAEEARTASEKMLRQMLLWMRDIVYRLDPEGRIVFINQAVSRFGFKGEELLGKYILDLVHAEDRQRCRKLVTERRTGSRRTSGAEFRLASQTGAATLDSSAPIMLLEAEGIYETDQTGTPVFLGTVGMAREISRRKRAEEQLLLSLETKELLLRELQHRVKNNLQVVLSLISLNRTRVKTPEAIKVCREIEGYISCMSSTHALLSHSKTGDQVNLGDMARLVFAAAAGLFGQQNVTPHFDLEDTFLHIDKALPCGMLLNEMFTNTFKHAFPDNQPGQVNIELRHLPDGRVKLMVSDNGVGASDDAPKFGDTIGMGLIHHLAAQLDAELQMSMEFGTQVQLIFTPAVSQQQLKNRITPEKLFLTD